MAKPQVSSNDVIILITCYLQVSLHLNKSKGLYAQYSGVQHFNLQSKSAEFFILQNGMTFHFEIFKNNSETSHQLDMLLIFSFNMLLIAK